MILFLTSSAYGESVSSDEVTMYILNGVRSYSVVMNGIDAVQDRVERKIEKNLGVEAEKLAQLAALTVQLADKRISTNIIKIKMRISGVRVTPDVEYRLDSRDVRSSVALQYTF